MRGASFLPLCLVCIACGPRPLPEPGAGGPAAAAPSVATAVPAVSGQPPASGRRGLAEKVCPPGPFSCPITGTLRAAAIPRTAASALDPNDSGPHLYEGAVWWRGALYFSDFRIVPGFPSRILRYVEGRGLEVVLPDSGTNGLALDAADARLLGGRHASKSVVRFSDDLRSFEHVAARYEELPFDSPNDLVARSDGNIYFTDPDFQAGERADQAATRVYRVAPDGSVSVVDESIRNPNGISLSPDERTLFVAGNLEQGYVKRYPIAADGSVQHGQIILRGVEVPDGMAFDCAGHLYVTEHTARRIRVITMQGEELGRIVGFDGNVTNVAFGGDDRRTLYVTTTSGLAALRMPVPGLPY